MARGVKWLLEWVEDKNSRQKLERKGKESADKVGRKWKDEGRGIGRSMRTSLGNAFTKVGAKARATITSIRTFAQSQFVKIAGYVAAAFAVAKIVQFGRESLKVYSESEEVWRRLGAQLDRVGVSFAQVEGEISGAARAMQDATKVGDEEFAATLTELVAISGDYEESLRRVGLVADLAAAKNLDMSTAAQLVGRAMIGETGTLSRYGIVADNAADAMALMEQRFGGMAAATVGMAGKTQMLKNEMDDFRQAMGGAMVAAGGGTSIMDTLIGTFKGAAIWTERHRDQLGAWGQVAVRVAVAVAKSLAYPIRIAFNFGQALTSFFALVATEIGASFNTAINKVIDGVNWAIRQMNRIKGISIQEMQHLASPKELREAGKVHFERLKGDLNDMLGATAGLGQSYRDIADAIGDAANAQENFTSLAREAGMAGEAAGGGGEAGPLGVPAPTEGLAEKVKKDTKEATDEVRTFYDFMDEQTQQLAQTMTDQWQQFFEGLFMGMEGSAEGFASMAEAAKGMGRAVISSMTEGFAAWQVAEGTAKLAAGTWPPNPAAMASAGLHFAAAGLFRALGAMAGRGGATGAGAGAAANATLSGRFDTPGMRDQQVPTTIIYLDPLNPYQPAVQDVVYMANQQATERVGQGATVRPTRHAPRNLRR